ncbi:hypothetical protein C0J52_24278 [Blattella germanica]|nr:hypothetical protein C0J52_24278 [Blattella germanica]
MKYVHKYVIKYLKTCTKYVVSELQINFEKMLLCLIYKYSLSHQIRIQSLCQSCMTHNKPQDISPYFRESGSVGDQKLCSYKEKTTSQLRKRLLVHT